MHKQHTTITLVLIFSTLFGGMLPSITFAASRTTPFSVGETTDPGTDAQPCGPTDTNCFPSLHSLQPVGTTTGSGGIMKFLELLANGVNYIGFRAPDAITTDTIWTLPAADGILNSVLTTDGSGNLSWTVPGASGNTTAGYFVATSTAATSTFAGGLTIGTNGFLFDLSTRSVGIGTTSPYAKLSVVGEVVASHFTATSTTATSTFIAGVNVGSGNGYFVNGARAISGAISAATSFGFSNTISGSGTAFGNSNTSSNVLSNAFGYGNTASGFFGNAFGYANQATSSNDVAFGFGNNAGGGGSIAFGYGNNAYEVNSVAIGRNVTNTTAGSLMIGPSNIAKLTILSSGNVGIGTTSPYAKLSVGGETVSTYFTATSTTATSTFYGDLALGGAGVTGSRLTTNKTSTATTAGNEFAISNTISDTGVTTSGIDSIFGVSNVLTHSGATAGTNNTYGVYNSISADDVVSGTSNAYGMYTTMSAGPNSTYTDNSFGMYANLVGTNAYGSRVYFNNATGVSSGYGMRLSPTGVLGVGMSEVYGAYVDNFTNATNVTGLYVADQGASATHYGVYTAGVTKSYFGGSVGIGTTSPYAKLSVVGEVVASHFTATSTTATSTFANHVSIASGKDYRIGGAPVLSGAASGGVIGFGNINAGTGGIAMGIGNTNTAGGFSASAIGVTNTSSNTLASAIGNSNTASGLFSTAVGYNNTASGFSSISVGYNNSATTSTASAFGVQNSAGGSNSLAIGYLNSAFAANSIAIGSNIINTTADSLMIGPSDAAKMTILQSGNVGIGTTSPYAKLSVVGEIVGAYFTGTSTTTSTFGGDINLSNKSAGIAFGGTRYLYASSTNDSVIFGENAGATFNSLTTYNTAIGFEAGRYASTSASDYNNFMGYRAGFYNTSTFNNLFGVQAGYSNTGTFNNLFGYAAGYNNTGSYNNLFGRVAGYFNTGSYNNLFGNDAGYFNTGSYNNLFGQYAGYQNTGSENNMLGDGAGYSSIASNSNMLGQNAGYDSAGLHNNLFGSSAGYSNTGSYNNILGFLAGNSNTGSYNNLFGYAAGYQNTGSYNEMFGYAAGYNLQATSSIIIGSEAFNGTGVFQAVNNVALGYRAGYAAQTGSSNNILLGYQAADNLTTGNNNIVIGYDIDNVTATADNRLNIGNLIFGTGLDGTGTTLASGNIGIGTTTPYAKLSVVGDVVASSFNATSTTATSTFANHVSIASEKTYRIGGAPVLSVDNTVGITAIGGGNIAGGIANNTAIGLSNSATAPFNSIALGNFNSATSNGSIAIGANVTNSTGGSLMIGPSDAAKLTILSSGNVGIGTTSPANKLSVIGNVSLGDFANTSFEKVYANDGVDNTGIYVIDKTSYIGTWQNASSLEGITVDGSGNRNGYSNLWLNYYSPSYVNIANGGGGLSVGADTGLTPASTLFVNGNQAIGFGPSVVAPINGLIVDGNVGIGTTSPYAKLSVVGQTLSDSFNATSSVGYQQGGTTLLTASPTLFNTFVGLGAGTSMTSGSQNTFIGYQAGQANTTGTNNTANGYSSFSLNDTGSDNTANGAGSLYSNTTGNSNTANGADALFSNTTGNSNTANGVAALFSNTTGYYNTTSGTYSLFSNTTGLLNTASGYASLYANTTGSNNTANGYNSLYLNTTGSNNTANGFYSLRSNTTGSNNLALGYQAGYNVTTGYGNVLLGSDVNTGGTAITTGYNNIGLGYNIKFPAVSSSNMLNIGNFLFANLPATTTATTIGNTPLTGKLGVGTSSPYAKLTVWGQGTGTGQAFEIVNNASTTIARFFDNGMGYFLGNIGIGTTSPYAKLSVVGDVVANYFTATSTTATSTFAGNVSAGRYNIAGSIAVDFGSSGTNIMMGRSNSSTASAGNSMAIGFQNTVTGTVANTAIGWGNAVSSATAGVAIGKSNTVSGASAIAIGANITNTIGGLMIGPSDASKVTIQTNGNVGIGTSTTPYKLMVQNTYGSLADLFDVSTTTSSSFATSSLFRITAAGNVGIGIAAPTAKLHVSSSLTTNGQIGGLNTDLSATLPGGSIYGNKTTLSGSIGLVPSATNVYLDHISSSASCLGCGLSSIYGSYVTFASDLSNTTKYGYYTDGYGAAGSATAFAANLNDSVNSIGYTASSSGSFVGNFLDFTQAGSSKFIVRGSGSIGIGTSTPYSKLTVATGDVGVFNGAICADNGGTVKCFGALTAGNVYGDGSSFVASDVAENYPVSDTSIDAGEVVMLAPELIEEEIAKRDRDRVKLSTLYKDEAPNSIKESLDVSVARATQGRGAVLGIISTRPGVLLGDTTGLSLETTFKPVALSGRVPLKVNAENGVIAKGDRITISSVPGIAARATATSSILIATALEDFIGMDSNATGTILAFVDLEHDEAGLKLEHLVSLASSSESIADDSFAGRFFERMRVWLADTASGITEIAANIFRGKEFHAEDRLCIGQEGNETCVTKEQLDQLLQNQMIASPALAQPQPDSTTPVDTTIIETSSAITPEPVLPEVGENTSSAEQDTPVIPAEETPAPADVSIVSPESGA